MGYYIAFKTEHDIELNRDYALIGQQFGGPLTLLEAKVKEAEARLKGWEVRIVSDEDLMSWKPKKQRLDSYLSREI